jgi:hypothetical protein
MKIVTRKTLILGIGSLIFLGIVGAVVFSSYAPQAYTIGEASRITERYLTSLNVPDLAIGEIMEFSENFYVIFNEPSTGMGAFEMLIDKTTGRIFPEYGPNMMWNLKYGHGGMMGGWNQSTSGDMPIDGATAVVKAQEFLTQDYPGTVADDPHPFYGYYTIHVTQDEEIHGMLSVNGYEGTVWYHNWHGSHIQN